MLDESLRTSVVRSVGLAAAALVTTVGLAGCAGTPTTSVPSQAPSNQASAPASSRQTSTPTQSARPRPAVTESNPPGDIPDDQVFVRFSPPGSGLSVKVPEGWARSTSGRTTVFTDKLNRIEIAPSKAGAVPTATTVRGELPKLQSAVTNYKSGKVTEERRAGGPVVLVTYEGDSPIDPVTGKVVRDAFERYVYHRAGHRLDLTLSGPTNADNVDPWKIVSESVQWQ